MEDNDFRLESRPAFGPILASFNNSISLPLLHPSNHSCVIRFFVIMIEVNPVHRE